MRLLYSLLTASLWMLSPLALAHPGIGGGLCRLVNNFDRCTQLSNCFWDADDQRCESRDPGIICGRFADPTSCDSSFACRWDAADERCELSGF
jgi:hypothetical protein